MNAEFLYAEFLQFFEGIGNLAACHAELGISGRIHDLESFMGFTGRENASRIIAAAHLLRKRRKTFLQMLNMRDVIQIDDDIVIISIPVFFIRCVIAGKHDFFTLEAASLRQHQFTQRGAVTAASFLFQNLQNGRIRCCLHREVFPESGIPGKSFLQFSGGIADTCFIIQMKRCGIFQQDFIQFFFCDKRFLHRRNCICKRTCFQERRPVHPDIRSALFLI